MKFAETLQSRFHSSKSPETIYRVLRSHTALDTSSRLQELSTIDFRGTVERDHFRISPHINYRNSFLPIISGTVDRDNGGSVVSMQAKIHPFVSGFTILWTCGILFFFLNSIKAGAWQGIAVSLFLLTGMGCLLYFGFFRSARNALRRLEELLK